MTAIRRCVDCRHHQRRRPLELFSATDLQTAGGLKARTEFMQQEKQYAEREALMFGAGEPFTHEPRHYDWCAAHTAMKLVKDARAGDEEALGRLMREGGAQVNPVTGDVVPIYALCIQMNPRGECEQHEPR